jgi:hypothetical protein
MDRVTRNDSAGGTRLFLSALIAGAALYLGYLASLIAIILWWVIGTFVSHAQPLAIYGLFAALFASIALSLWLSVRARRLLAVAIAWLPCFFVCLLVLFDRAPLH